MMGYASPYPSFYDQCSSQVFLQINPFLTAYEALSALGPPRSELGVKGGLRFLQSGEAALDAQLRTLRLPGELASNWSLRLLDHHTLLQSDTLHHAACWVSG